LIRQRERERESEVAKSRGVKKTKTERRYIRRGAKEVSVAAGHFRGRHTPVTPNIVKTIIPSVKLSFQLGLSY
jgi:hypothetical protein